MTDERHAQAQLLLPAGTRIVTRAAVRNAAGEQVCLAGAVGVITRAPVDPLHAYRVRLPDGTEIALRRAEFAILTHHKQGELGPERDMADPDLYQYVIYRCVVGSRAYGLDTAASDVDRRGIYLPPAALHWSLYGVPGQLERPEREEVYWELQKFLMLALRANPNVLECLYTPVVEHATPLASELRAMRAGFLSQLVYQTYNGYVLSQFKKLEQDLRTTGAIKWKHAMHLIRLLLAGITILREGYVPVQVGDARDQLLAIRRGVVPWAEVDAWRLDLHRAFDAALAQTRLPERPDYPAANAFLLKARQSVVEDRRAGV